MSTKAKEHPRTEADLPREDQLGGGGQQPSTAAPPSTEPPSTAIAEAPKSSLPAYLQNYEGPMGSENIEREDITIPRLKIGQAISDEVKDGLVKEGSLYINVTSEAIWNPGDPPLGVLIVAQSKEYVLWRPREDNGGGILARATPIKDKGVTRYKWDNPNTRFEVKVKGVVKVVWETKSFIDEDGLGDWGSEIPGDEESGIAATANHNYLVLIPQHTVVAAVSLARSGVKVAKNLNAAIKMGDASRVPLAVRKFNITTVDDIGEGGDKYKNWKFTVNGFLDDKDAELASVALEYAKQYREAGFKVEDEVQKSRGEGEEDIPF